ncbi:MAG: type II secretion system minor pseudopilin GspK [Pseudomonadota bacterium]|nr:type II secretion system minor pseudopilin GspK [Pseudomonadota bacterium]
MRAPTGPERERGAALLAVLLLVAVMGAISAAALEKLRLSTALAINSAASDQSRAFAVAIESLLTLTIDDLTARSQDRTIDAGGWNGAARQYPLPGGGFAEAVVRDGGNCFNVNSLVEGSIEAGFAARPAGIDQLVALLRLLQITEGNARRVAEAAADWADTDLVPLRQGAEDAQYSGGQPAYRTGNILFAEVSELRAVAGMTPEIYAVARPWLCALPVAELSAINVNTLKPEQAPLLAMLAPAQIPIDNARRILAARPATGWGSLADFYAMPGLEGTMLPLDVQLQPQLRTRWFALDLTVALQGAELQESALVDARISPSRIAARRWGSDE